MMVLNPQILITQFYKIFQDYGGYVTFVWVYGIFIGGYSYTLKMYVYQKVRARNFPWAWGYIQCSQALPNMFGIPLTGRLQEKFEYAYRIFMNDESHITR